MARATRATTKTPTKARASSKSPPATRSRTTRRASGTSSKSTKSATPQSPIERTKTPTPKKERVSKKPALPESSSSSEEEIITKRPVSKKKAPESAPAAPATHVVEPIKTISRIIYALLLLISVCAFFMPEKLDEYIPGTGEKTCSKKRLFALSTFSLALQFIAAAQGDYAGIKRSLQYGMISWLGLIAVALHSGAEIDATAPIVMSALFIIIISIWSCYYVE